MKALIALFTFCAAFAAYQAHAQAREIVISEDLKSVSGSIGRSFQVIEIADPNENLKHFEDSLNHNNIQMNLDSCSLLIDIPVGTARGNHSYGAYCTTSQKDNKEPKVIMLCDDNMVGHFALKKAAVADNKKALISFTYLNCFGG